MKLPLTFVGAPIERPEIQHQTHKESGGVTLQQCLCYLQVIYFYIKMPNFEENIYQSVKKSQKRIYNFKKMCYTDYVCMIYISKVQKSLKKR